MATRFFFSASAAAAVSPAFSAEWEHQNTVRREMDTTKTNTTGGTVAYAPDAADHLADQDALFVQYVSKPLAAQTISAQTVGLAVGALEDNAGNNCFLTWKVFVVDNAGTTVRGTIVAIRRDGLELGTAAAERFDSATSSSLALSANDRLVIELGLGGLPVAAGGVQGHNGSMAFSDIIANTEMDGVDGGTGTTPWLNFGTDTIMFAGAVVTSLPPFQRPWRIWRPRRSA